MLNSCSYRKEDEKVVKASHVNSSICSSNANSPSDLSTINLLITRRIQHDYIVLHVNYTFPSHTLMKIEYSRQIFQKSSTLSVMKICPVGAALFLSDRRADVTKVIVVFRSFANTPQKKEIPKKNFDMYLCSIKINQHTCGQTNTAIVHCCLTLILRRSRTGTVWFYTSTSNKRAARPKLYTKSLTRDLKRMYSRLTLVRISINL